MCCILLLSLLSLQFHNSFLQQPISISSHLLTFCDQQLDFATTNDEILIMLSCWAEQIRVEKLLYCTEKIVMILKCSLNWYSHSTSPCLVPKGTDSTVSGTLVQTPFCWSVRPGKVWQTAGVSRSRGWSDWNWWNSTGLLPSNPMVLK